MINIFKDDTFLFLAEHVQDTVDGMEVLVNGKLKRLILDVDYTSADEVQIGGYTGFVLNGRKLESVFLSEEKYDAFQATFKTIPTKEEFRIWNNPDFE